MLDEHLKSLVREAVADALCEVTPERSERPEILTRKQAAALLQISTHQIDRLAEAGKIRRHYLADSPRYLRSELLEDLRSGRAAKSETPGS